MAAPARPQLLTVEEAAEYLNVPVRFIRRLVAERRIAVVRLGRHVRFEVAELDEFIERGTAHAVSFGSEHGAPARRRR